MSIILVPVFRIRNMFIKLIGHWTAKTYAYKIKRSLDCKNDLERQATQPSCPPENFQKNSDNWHFVTKSTTNGTKYAMPRVP